ncbi:alpha-2-macroglobulin-like protein 1 isoform X2 [Rana temporaria]|uniref:alpha-2-macroglobulin-like protein 1 isoform X2 n=1 Tax=Rana temporaria TaxID=8407 RepID=UPI001AAE0956|nr:alpha-2-macroglobulin-like protein 1 isoform X2 [Rana temporaria]
MIWVLCLLLSLKGALAQSDKKPNFGLFVPPDLYYPSEETFCMHTSNDLKGHSKINVNLETSAGTRTLYTVQPNMPPWHCQSFQVPEPSADTEKVHIEVQGMDAGGDKIQFASKPLTLRKKSIGTFVQTDKYMYKPGQTVNIRLASINQDMEVQNKNFSLVEFQDPQGNLLAQWRDVPPKNGIAEMSFQLAEEPKMGKYKIKANNVLKEIEVQEYVLPKFEVEVEAPNSVSIQDIIVEIKISAKYTYGEKVPGNVNLKVCQKKQPRYWWWWRSQEEEEPVTKDLCHEEKAKTDQTGKMQYSLDLGKFNLRSSDYNRELIMDISMEEEGTGVTQTASKTIKLESQLTKVLFEDTKSYFMPGVPYKGKLSLTSFDGQPLASKKVQIKASYNGEENTETFVTDSNGKVPFELSTEKWGKNSVNLYATTDQTKEPYSRSKVSVTYGTASLYLKDLYVETKSYLYIRPVKSSAPCHQNVAVTVDYCLAEEEDDGSIEFFYLVTLEGKIVQQGQKKVERSKGDARSGSIELSLPIRDISPSGNILVFMVSDSGTVAADTRTAQVTPCLKHAVTLKFSETKVLPKSNVNMQLQADGGSYCALRSVDKSVVLMKPEDELTESKFQKLVIPERTYIRSDSLDYSLCSKPQPWEDDWEDNFGRSPWWWHSYPEKKKDIQNIIQDINLYLLSTWKISAPITCKTQSILPMAKSPPILGSAVGSLFGAPGASPALAAPGVMNIVNYDDPAEIEESDVDSVNKPRDYFPETWLWKIHLIPSSGSSEIPVTVPDTITEWSAQMFCVGNRGLGLSAPESLTVFMPFFNELQLPFSIIRGEKLQVNASLFNYMSEEMMIQSTLAESDDYVMDSPKDHTVCVGGGQKKMVSWQIILQSLGEVNISVTSQAVNGQCGAKSAVIPDKGSRDTVIQNLLVKPEGTLVEQTHNSMLIVKEGSIVPEKINLELPNSYVVGSERGYISFTGDIMGSALNNLEKLLAMSSGCGEQNMLNFCPNIYVLQYLKSSNQLTDSILEKGKKFLEAGLQRQLNYRRADGSYSAFGVSDKEGSTWLTAFVIKSYSQAREFIFVDDKHIKEGMSFLAKQQKDDGCFKATGRLLNNGMKGGVDDEVSLTAYVTVALLESGLDIIDPMVTKAMQCLKNEPTEKNTPYKTALKAYAYTMANYSEEHSNIMQLLDGIAKKGDGMMYWSQEDKVKKESYWCKPKSVDVEITAYALLTFASHPNPSIGDMVPITRWMCKQQNGNGGFSSTQDTVMGLYSLSRFAALTSGKSGEVVLDVTSEKGFQHTIRINNDNKLLLQMLTLPEVPGEYLVTASGVGTAFMQVVQRYHAPPEVKEAAFSLSVQPQCMEGGKMAILLEFWYKGSRTNSNMVLMEIKLLSGYVSIPESIEEVKRDSDVQRVEIKDDLITIYWEKVTSDHKTVEILFKRSVQVTGLKPAYVKLLDYYMPEEMNTVCYLAEC